MLRFFQCYSHRLAAHTHAKSEILHLIGLFKLLMLYYRKDEEIVDHWNLLAISTRSMPRVHSVTCHGCFFTLTLIRSICQLHRFTLQASNLIREPIKRKRNGRWDHSQLFQSTNNSGEQRGSKTPLRPTTSSRWPVFIPLPFQLQTWLVPIILLSSLKQVTSKRM